MRSQLLYPLCATFLALVGCSSMETHAVTAASKDFSCAREQTVVTDQFGGVYRLEGCGFAATYQCSETGSLRVHCDVVPGSEAMASRGARVD